MRRHTWLAMPPWAAAVALLSGCGDIHLNLHYHAPAAAEPEMTLELPPLEDPDEPNKVDQR